MEVATITIPLYRWENWEAQGSKDYPRIIQLVSGRAGVQTQFDPSVYSSPLNSAASASIYF